MKLIVKGLLVLASLSFLSCTESSNSGSGTKEIFFYGLQDEPGDLNPLRSNDSYAWQVYNQHTYYTSNIVENLLAADVETYEPIPWLAERWEVSKDGKDFTFYLRKGVKFQDGSEMTAEDVKFSFEAIFDDLYEAFVSRAFYSNFEREAKIIDPYTIRFRAKSSYFLNLDVIGGLTVLPKKTYSKQSKENRLAKTVVGSGPYKLEKWNKGKNIIVSAYKDWWGNKDPEVSKRYRFKKIVFKIVKDSTLRRAMMERGKLDFDIRVRDQEFVKKMVDGPWGKTVLKVKADNSVPKNLSYIGWNNKHKIFTDKKVRKAMALLVNRPFINERFYYGLKDLATGPFRVQGDYASPKVKPLPFSPEEAKKILTAQGWKDTDKDGILDKLIDGQKTNLEFNLISANKNSEKILTTIKEDMKKAGVKMVINIIDWNALIKAKDERKFDAIIMAWGGGGVDPDPTQIWHSKSAKGSGSNYISYKNPEVDSLIEKGILETDKAKRVKVYNKIHEMIAEDQPYTFLFEDKYQLYVVNSRVKRDGDTKKYSIGSMYWSLPE